MRQFYDNDNKKFLIHVRRVFIVLGNWLLNHDYFFKIIGQINRYCHLIESIVLLYPAVPKYALHFGYKKYLVKAKWKPHLIGLIWQNRKMKFVFAISATEKDFVDPDNQKNLKRLVERLEKIRKLLKAYEKRFAGILPGILLSRGLIKYSPELAGEIEMIVEAEKQIRILEKYELNVPLLILGGKGFIGRELVKRFSKNGRDVYSIDKEDFPNKWPAYLQGKKAVLINVSRKEALLQYIPFLWPELIVINEVYPEPTEQELKKLKEIGIRCYHIVGVKGKAIPNFPYAYQGGIPCCAAHFVKEIKIIIKRLT